MNQNGDRAAGRMADATTGKLFNQAALPSRGQGETLCWQIKEKDSQPDGHSHTRTHTRHTLILFISQPEALYI